MKFSKSLLAVAALTSAPGISAFAPSPNAQARPTSLNMVNEESMKKAATSFAAAAFLLSNVAAAAPALAVDDMDFGSTQVIAARSGGRAGGRSSAARAPSRPVSRSTTVIQRNTVIAPPVYSSPSVIVAPPVYNPMPGLGLSIGLNAMNQIGNDMRDYRQEAEIRDTRSELMRSQAREAEMEARLRQLEAQQQGQISAQQQQQLLMQQQMMLQQQAK